MYKTFEVVGAGDLKLSESCNVHCGDKIGFSIGVSWTNRPYIGGVISMEDAKALADHIYQKLSKIDKYKGEIRKFKIESINKEV